jgi:cytoskeletal protein CcmA (bactofilin family)
MSSSTNGNGTREKRTLVEEGTEFKGTMSSTCPIVVMGKVEGEISGPSMEIAETGVVAGTVRVKELHSRGEVAGNVGADAVYLSGKVRDNTVIRAKTLEASLSRTDGAMEVVFGVCELSIGDEPSRQAEVGPAVGAAAVAAAPARGAARESTPPPVVATTERAATENEGGGGKRARTGTQPPPA